jgi:6,7-dimethyl-8-ribityllumazine synthase
MTATIQKREIIPFDHMPHMLIVEARFYPEVADMLFDGAQSVITMAGGTFDRVTVPGSLEIPAVIAMAEQGRANHMLERPYDGYVALGCVIRGETLHFEIVCYESARGLTNVGLRYGCAIGNGILTCENMDQALDRARREGQDKGGDAAYAALKMVHIRTRFGLNDKILMDTP